MIKQFSVEAVPETDSINAVPELLERMRSDGLPAFVLNAVGMNDIVKAVSDCNMRVCEGAERRTVMHPYWDARGSATTPAIIDDKPMHIDTTPNEFVADYLYIHHTSRGSLNAHFFEVADEWRDDLKERKRLLLPEGAQQLYEQGEVDDAMLRPVDHLATVATDSTVIFRHSGHNPLAHYFETIEFPRTSSIRMARVLAPLAVAQNAA